jgi:hypothetical protein
MVIINRDGLGYEPRESLVRKTKIKRLSRYPENHRYPLCHLGNYCRGGS